MTNSTKGHSNNVFVNAQNREGKGNMRSKGEGTARGVLGEKAHVSSRIKGCGVWIGGFRRV